MRQAEIKSAKHVGDYKVRFIFGDGKSRVIDFSNVIKSTSPYVTPYRDIKKFSKFKISPNDIRWGDWDMCFTASKIYTGNIAPISVRKKSYEKAFGKKKASEIMSKISM